MHITKASIKSGHSICITTRTSVFENVKILHPKPSRALNEPQTNSNLALPSVA